ncbi:LacI family DNA-binding transcriptional regulator [Pseudoroseicyclus tamaricis]|uniref:LacI family DNA-binding transcriptional regulator n=1 Tax=Pseudoroseicyclus tamaricis TaxID=2705421 RepID=A0A6B2JZ61_9RHOB|nr:substrate-binding domain-containing protein [Pseudoroseicyclus tamaricis]NDV00662.1 LacI family DNA-binding transcriptional regulator [Pseudoroseicyclus tamaricis]
MNLKELAQNLGLSQTTVSRALNGYPEVSETTRRRVVDAARQHNYRPNTRAKGLATGRSMAIGHVIPLSTKHEMVNPVFADFIAGAGETYARAGYDMILSVVEDGDEARIYRSLKSRGTVDGVVLHGPRANDPRLALLDEIGLVYAVHGRSTSYERPYCWLDIDNETAFRRATDFLLDLGHRRIALINGLEFMDFALRRRAGFEEALRARGVPFDTRLMRSDEMTEDFGYDAASDMMELAEPPTAFLVSSIICALGVRRAIEDAGLKMGRDVSVITHDDALSYLPNGSRGGRGRPIFTATRSSVRQAGRRLSELLLEHIEHPRTAPRQVLLDSELMVGGSTGPAPHGGRT